MKIRPYEESDRLDLIHLWKDCGLTVPQNDPMLDIDRKLEADPRGLIVGYEGDTLIASCMYGYEGHRGWINYLAVAPSHRKRGFARQLLLHAEYLAKSSGCPKVNLQIRSTNEQAIGFYQAIGYTVDSVISMGKRLSLDSHSPIPSSESIGTTETIRYSNQRELPTEQVVALYQANEWSSASIPESLLPALRDSHSLVTAWQGDKLIGLANAISDGHLVVYYPHLLVLPSYQKQGIGSQLLKRIQEKYSSFHMQMLTADGQSTDFYKRHGFERAGQTEPMWIYSGHDH